MMSMLLIERWHITQFITSTLYNALITLWAASLTVYLLPVASSTAVTNNYRQEYIVSDKLTHPTCFSPASATDSPDARLSLLATPSKWSIVIILNGKSVMLVQ